MNNSETGNNTKNGYQVISIDSNNKRIFVSRKPIVSNDETENLIMQIDKKIEYSDLIDEHLNNPDFKTDDFEVIDTTDWEYDSYEDLTSRIYNYETPRKQR